MKQVVLINGKNQSQLSVFNRLTQFGDGLFETCVVDKDKLLFWNAHFIRLEQGCKRLKIATIAERRWLKDIRAALLIAKLDRAVVKIILSRGESIRGYGFSPEIKPVRIVIVSEMPKKIPHQYTLTTCDSGYSSNPLLSNIKHCNRLEQILARANMHSDECIMLGANGNVVSTTQANIFAIKNGVLLTPNLDNCGIQGTRRSAILEVAGKLAIKVEIGALSLPQLLECDEVFISNSVIGIKSVNNINTQAFIVHTITDKINYAFLNSLNLPMHSKTIKLKPRFPKLLALLALLLSVWVYQVKDVNIAEQLIYQLPAGANIRQVTNDLQDLGYIHSATYAFILAKLLNVDAKLKRGYYQLSPNMSINRLLQDFASANVANRTITLVEGQTMLDYYQQLSKNSMLKSANNFQKTLQLSGAQQPYEGYFWPDTYNINIGDSVLSVFKRAHRIMQYKLRTAWQGRAKNLQLKTPNQALILASLIEKETAHNAEKSKIAGVFMRRLQLGMRLQTDPTVVYALGTKYSGSLSKQDLKFNSRYNTYRYQGLPPGPISSVSATSLHAAMHPADGDSLYFVAKKDGSHAFAKTYQQHQQNIKKYLK